MPQTKEYTALSQISVTLPRKEILLPLLRGQELWVLAAVVCFWRV